MQGQRKRGLLFTPLAGLIAAVSFAGFLGIMDPAEPPGSSLMVIVLGTVIGTIFALPTTLLVLPFVRAERPERGWRSLLYLICCAALASFLSPALFLVPLALARFTLPGFMGQLIRYDLAFGAFEAIGGAITGLGFYARTYRRPSLDRN
jgi:hypothetical protein